MKIETTYHVRLNEAERFDYSWLAESRMRVTTIVFEPHNANAVVFVGMRYRKDGSPSATMRRVPVDLDDIPQEMRLTLIALGVRAGQTRTA
jgi:hypothetical protein